MIYFVSEFSVVDIRLLPRDRRGEVIYPNIPKEKGIFALFMLWFILTGSDWHIVEEAT